MDFGDELFQEFLVESGEHLDLIERSLLELEKTPDSPDLVMSKRSKKRCAKALSWSSQREPAVAGPFRARG